MKRGIGRERERERIRERGRKERRRGRGKSVAMFGPICRRKFTALEEVDDDITLDEPGWAHERGHVTVRFGVPGLPVTQQQPFLSSLS